jgi:hypothetical protein
MNQHPAREGEVLMLFSGAESDSEKLSASLSELMVLWIQAKATNKTKKKNRR